MFRFDPPTGSALAARSLMMANDIENGGNGTRGLPAWMRFVAAVGAAWSLAGYMVWSDRTHLITRLDAHAKLIEEMRDEGVKHYQRDEMLDAQILAAAKETNRIVLAECLNNARRNPNPEEAWNRCIGREK
jgi:hypothetical protein